MAIENNPDPAPAVEPREREVPASSAWPMIMALGLMLAFAGLVTSVVTSAVGFVLFVAGAVGWFREVLPYEHREMVAIQPAPPPVIAHEVGVDYLRVGEMGNRAVLPLEIYPYSAGIRGGIAGGIPIAILAVIHRLRPQRHPLHTHHMP